MAVNNSTILTSAWLNGSNDYQQRVPDPTQASVAEQIEFLTTPMNRKYFNEFMDNFVNRFCDAYVRSDAWENPLRSFVREYKYGSTIQETYFKWIKAHSFQDDAETLLKLHRPEAESAYHTANYEVTYPISTNDYELMDAVTDEYGLNRIISGIMQVPINSDQYDAYKTMVQLIAEYEGRWGFYKHNLSAAPTDEATGKEFLTAVRTYAGTLAFPSTLYNAQRFTDIPVFAKPDELVLFVTPATQAALDVNTLASVFNVDLAEIKYRTILIDEFPVPNAVALLTTEAFFQCANKLYGTFSFFNPQTLSTNYYLQHRAIMSVSPFVPAVLFTTDEGSTPAVVKQTVSGVTVTADPTSAKPGDEVQLTVSLTGTISPQTEGIEVRPDACVFEVTAASAASAGTPIQLNARTYVDDDFVLHIQKTGLATGNVLTVTGTATYQNPSGTTSTYTDTATVTIS